MVTDNYLTNPAAATRLRGSLGAAWRAQWLDTAGDGFEWVQHIDATPGHTALASWGRDGWDLGAWPLVVYAYGHTHTDPDTPWRLLERIEGDVTLWGYRTRGELHTAIDKLARGWWAEDPTRHGSEVADALASTPESEPLPIQFRGPFSWERLGVFAATGFDPYQVTPIAATGIDPYEVTP